MYISQVVINNYRSFKENTILFQPGINILIGHNNAGKTNLLRALQIVFDRAQQRLSIDDFNASITDFSQPPKVEISVIIKETVAAAGANNIWITDWIKKATLICIANNILMLQYPEPAENYGSIKRNIGRMV